MNEEGLVDGIVRPIASPLDPPTPITSVPIGVPPVIVPSPTTVPAPTNLQASAAQGLVTLTWLDNSNNEDGFRVRRRGPTDADFIDIAEVPPNVTTYADNTVQPQTTYTYRVRSFRAGGGGGVSNDATVTTPAIQPATVAAPTNLQASAAQGRVTLTWFDNSNNEDGFRIRRRGATDADFVDIAEVPPNVTTYADNTVQPQTTYVYRIRSFRASGGGGVSNDATVTTPATQPTTVAAPTNLQASAAQGRVTLTWFDNSNNEDGFRIRRRGPTDADFIDIAEVPPNVTTYNDNSVQPQTTYVYRVRSFRASGGGGVSNDATVTTPATQPTTVAAPTNLQASAAQGRITLTWFDNSNNEDGFRVRRRGPTDADFIDVAEVPPNVTTYNDNSVQPQTTYVYRVRSFRASGGGGVSNDATVTTPATQPTAVAAPTNLQANATQGRVTLTWLDNSNNEDGFRVRRRGPTDADFVDIAEVAPNVTTYADTTVQAQTTYTYRVRSFRAGGGGGVSNDATVTTPGTSKLRALSSSAKGALTVTAGEPLTIPVGQFTYTVNGIPTLEFVNASAVLVPPEGSVTLSISPANPIETFTNVSVTLQTKPETPARTYDILITGQSTDVPGPAGAYPTQTIRVEVLPARTVTLSVDPMSQFIRVGDPAPYQVKLDRVRANGVAVELEVNEKQLPDGITATFDPAKPTGNSSTLVIKTDRALVPVNLEELELRVRSKTSGIKVIPASARLRFKPEVTFTATPMMDTVARGGTKTFNVVATRMYYNGQVKLDLSVRGERPNFTSTIRPVGDSQFEVEIKIASDTTPRDYTFVATPRFPSGVKNGIATEATFTLKVEDAVAPVVVRLSDTTLNLKPGTDEDVNIAIDSASFTGAVTVTLDTAALPFGIEVDPTEIRLERGGFNGAEVFNVKATENASGQGSLTFRGTVDGMPNARVTFVPEDLKVNVVMAGSVILKLVGSLPVDMGDPASYTLIVESFGYSGTVEAFITDAPGPVTFDTDSAVMVSPGQTTSIRFLIDTGAVPPGTYSFGVGATPNPPAPISEVLPAKLTVDPKDGRTAQSPSIGTFTPKMGRGGDVISIGGTGFVANATQVSLSGAGIEIVSLEETELRVRIPANAASGQFTVQTPNGSVTSKDSFTVKGAAPTLAAPTDLRATLAGQQVNLRWNDNSEEDGFRVERRAMEGAYQPIATVPRGSTSFADASATPGETYFYRVRAFTAAVESLPSNEIGVSVPLPQPTASVRLSAVPATQRIIPGAIVSTTVVLARTSYAGPVDLTVEGLPFGAIATFSDDPARGNSSILTIATAATSPGIYRLTVRGSASEVKVEPAAVTVTVLAPPRVPTIPIRPSPRPIDRDLRPGFSNPDADLN
jgi:hypothetical protein